MSANVRLFIKNAVLSTTLRLLEYKTEIKSVQSEIRFTQLLDWTKKGEKSEICERFWADGRCFPPVRGQTPPACDESTDTNTRWRLQYDVYQYFLPENDLSESSLFSGHQAVAGVQQMTAVGKRVIFSLTQNFSSGVEVVKTAVTLQPEESAGIRLNTETVEELR